MNRMERFAGVVVFGMSFGAIARAQDVPPAPGRQSASVPMQAFNPQGFGQPTTPAPIQGGAVSFVASPGVALHRFDATRGATTRLCLAPCNPVLSGRERLALSLDGGTPLDAPEALLLSPGSRVEGEYRDNSAWRRTGWIILGLGVPSAIALIATGASLSSTRESTATVMGGAIAGGLSLIVGVALVFTGDDAHVHLATPVPQ